MTEPIDLTDEAEASSYAAKDEGSRKRVVALAEGLNERLRVADGPRAKRLRTVGTAVDGVEFPGQGPAGPTGGEQALGFGLPKPAAAAPATTTQAADQAAGATANITAILHAERLQRMGPGAAAALRPPDQSQQSTGAYGSSPGKPRATGAMAAAAATAAAFSQQAAAAASQHAAAGGPAAPSQHRDAAAASTSSQQQGRPMSILTWNLWFDEEMELVARMRAVGDTIEREGYPDLLLFQEVTQNMVLIFSQTAWYRRYHCSPLPNDGNRTYFTLLLARRDTVTLPGMQPWMNKDFDNSQMGRSILYTRVVVGGRPLVVGTTHLESPVGKGPQQMTAQRKEQLLMALRELQAAAGPAGDVVMAGDLNWADNRDGSVPLPPHWADAWTSLMPNQPGFTYDCQCNPMLTGRWPGSRLDRMLCRLSGAVGAAASSAAGGDGRGGGGSGGWKLGSIKMLGTQALPGLTAVNKGKRVPVLPSDHFGLLLKLLPGEMAFAGGAAGHVLGGGSQPAAAPAANGGGPSRLPGGAWAGGQQQQPLRGRAGVDVTDLTADDGDEIIIL